MRMPAPDGDGAKTVFGHRPLAVEKWNEICLEYEAEKFKKIVERARNVYDEKKKTQLQLGKPGGVHRLSQLSAKKKRAVIRKAQRQRGLAERRRTSGDIPVSWKDLTRSLKGSPRIYIEPGAASLLPGRGLDEQYGAKALREYVETSLPTFVRSCVPRAVIVVQDVASVPDSLVLAAACTGSLVTEDLAVFFMRYRPLGAHSFAFSQRFVQRHKDVIKVARAASERPRQEGAPGVRVLSMKNFREHLAAEKQEKKWTDNWSFLYIDADEPELSVDEHAGQRVRAVARTLDEFLRRSCRLEETVLPE